jgi:hypothetical protein
MWADSISRHLPGWPLATSTSEVGGEESPVPATCWATRRILRYGEISWLFDGFDRRHVIATLTGIDPGARQPDRWLVQAERATPHPHHPPEGSASLWPSDHRRHQPERRTQDRRAPGACHRAQLVEDGFQAVGVVPGRPGPALLIVRPALAPHRDPRRAGRVRVSGVRDTASPTADQGPRLWVPEGLVGDKGHAHGRDETQDSEGCHLPDHWKQPKLDDGRATGRPRPNPSPIRKRKATCASR